MSDPQPAPENLPTVAGDPAQRLLRLRRMGARPDLAGFLARAGANSAGAGWGWSTRPGRRR